MANQEKVYDLVIVGAGPAGLSAAVNAAARNLDFVILGSDPRSPKLLQAPEINNYLGYVNISGKELSDKFFNHIQKLDIDYREQRVDNIYDQGDRFSLLMGDETITAHSLILAVGVSNEQTLPGEEELVGQGVSYCATCDGPLYRGKTVAGLVHTDEGVEDIIYLSDIAEQVYIVTDRELDDNIVEKVEIIDKEPVRVTGKNRVEGLKFEDDSMIEVEGVFVFRRVTPPDKLMSGLETEDDHLKVNRRMATSKEGVFAAGDCTGFPYQIGKAAGEGQIAALSAASYIQKKR